MITVFLMNDQDTTLRELYDWKSNGYFLLDSCTDTNDSLELIEKNKPNIVLVNLPLPDISQDDICKKLSAYYPACQVILLTGSDSFESVLTALRSNVADYLLKPVTEDALSAALFRAKEQFNKIGMSLSSDPVTSLMNLHNQTDAGNKNRLITLAVEYIDAHLTEPDLSLKKVAASIFTNESYLSRIFKKELSISMIEYITRQRIAESIRLLNNTNLKVYEIAEQVGFRDAHYFGICFKKQMGVTVKEFRNR